MEGGVGGFPKGARSLWGDGNRLLKCQSTGTGNSFQTLPFRSSSAKFKSWKKCSSTTVWRCCGWFPVRRFRNSSGFRGTCSPQISSGIFTWRQNVFKLSNGRYHRWGAATNGPREKLCRPNASIDLVVAGEAPPGLQRTGNLRMPQRWCCNNTLNICFHFNSP